jgi:hypothetical protein
MHDGVRVVPGKLEGIGTRTGRQQAPNKLPKGGNHLIPGRELSGSVVSCPELFLLTLSRATDTRTFSLARAHEEEEIWMEMDDACSLSLQSKLTSPLPYGNKDETVDLRHVW